MARAVVNDFAPDDSAPEASRMAVKVFKPQVAAGDCAYIATVHDDGVSVWRLSASGTLTRDFMASMGSNGYCKSLSFDAYRNLNVFTTDGDILTFDRDGDCLYVKSIRLLHMGHGILAGNNLVVHTGDGIWRLLLSNLKSRPFGTVQWNNTPRLHGPSTIFGFIEDSERILVGMGDSHKALIIDAGTGDVAEALELPQEWGDMLCVSGGTNDQFYYVAVGVSTLDTTDVLIYRKKRRSACDSLDLLVITLLVSGFILWRIFDRDGSRIYPIVSAWVEELIAPM
ncbi:hypothetical protein AAF712_010351 [Marasmius tenuissimus]|uniref:Uncharacterized protein n=1 Tax=Marasmius tenuissimus TaxID=585030 RepID=A0ABR2ZN26_9AGAR